MHRHGAQTRRNGDAVFRRHDVQLLEKLGEADIRRPLVDDDAHGALGRVRAQINHRAGKARIAHRRHGDQKLAIQVAVVLGMGSCLHASMLQQFQCEGRGNGQLRQAVPFSPQGLTKP
jgi:hypothetical protein